jgi:hypothetical protein
MVVWYEDGSKGTVLYSRYLMEQLLGQQLDKNDIVHHIDGDKTNDALENLQVVNRKLHMKEHPAVLEKGAALFRNKAREPFTHGTVYGWMKVKCTCAVCSTAKRVWQDERNRKRRAGGPRGKYSKAYHGDNSMYASGCRCEACTIAHREHAREYRQKLKR